MQVKFAKMPEKSQQLERAMNAERSFKNTTRGSDIGTQRAVKINSSGDDTIRSTCPCCGAKLQNQHLHVDFETNCFLYQDRSLHLKPSAAEVMQVLAAQYPRVATLDQLAAALWGNKEPEDAYATLRVLMSQLRRALREGGFSTLKIASRYGVGYALTISTEEGAYA